MSHPSKPFIMVTWGDAYGSVEVEQREDEISHEPAVYQLYGWLLRSNEKGITVAAEWNSKSNAWRGISFVPRGMVIEEVELSLSKKRKSRKGVACATPVSSV